VASARGWSAAPVRHGVSVIRSGRRHTLGLVFHDAAWGCGHLPLRSGSAGELRARGGRRLAARSPRRGRRVRRLCLECRMRLPG